MTIRIVCQETDGGAAVHVGGPAKQTLRSFVIDCPELEAWLAEQPTYGQRSVMGVEVNTPQPEGSSGD